MTKQEVNVTKMGFCKIEGKETIHRLLPNGKWVCISSNCSYCSGQKKELELIPARKRYV